MAPETTTSHPLSLHRRRLLGAAHRPDRREASTVVVRATLRGMEKQPAIVARTPTDMLAAVPCALGFEPEESLVMLTFGARPQGFHARVAMPATPAEMTDAVLKMVWAAITNQVVGVVIVAYTDDRVAASRAVDALAFELGGKGFEVTDILLVQGDHYWSWWPEERGSARPQRFDARTHPFRAQAVLHGQVVLGSREELAATLDPVPDPDVAAALEEAAVRTDNEVEETRWLRATLPALSRARRTPSAKDSARVILAVEDPQLLEVAVSTMEGGDPGEWIDLWRHLTRCAPDSHRGGPAALLAFTGWRAGDGALAWCAVDRCLEAEPGHPLAEMVAGLLEHAVPPSVWR